jgi:hypothetical protein|tara:strand:+ start:5187 stop:5585 length:399 start_codon:yes stop_codon:yes gene_type:complete
MATKKSQAFDFNNYVIGRETESKILKIPDTGESFEVSIKPLSWAKRNQFISRNLQLGVDGASGFNADGYVRDCLKEMITEAPWGRTTEAFLLSIDDRLGGALETLVPKAFNEESEDNTSDEIDIVKKEPSST